MMPCMDSKTVKPSATLSTFISKEPSICESSARPILPHTGQRSPSTDDHGTPSHKYATCACSDQRQFWPQSNSINVNSNRSRGTSGTKKSGPDCSARDPFTARGISARAVFSLYTVAEIVAVNECRAIARVRTSVSNDDPKQLATFRAFERLHHVPSGDRRDFF